MTGVRSDENVTVAMVGPVERPIPSLSPSARRLFDITNTTHNVKLAIKDENVVHGDKDHIEKLHKENAMMLRAIAEKERIIQIQCQQIQKLKENLMEITRRNWEIAQSNSQLLAEVNLGKDKRKLQQHEFGITSGMLKARISELEGTLKTISVRANGKYVDAKELESDVSKPHNHNQRRLSRVPSSIVPSRIDQSARKCRSTEKRMSLRRQSGNFKREASERAELVKTTEMTPRPPDSLIDVPMQEADSAGTLLTDVDCEKMNLNEGKSKEKEQQEEDANSTRSNKSTERLLPSRRRSSIVRPMRSVAQKVATYKEPPLNIKMRRDE